MTKDLTQGSPRALILNLTIPTMLGMLFQQFYSMVDTILVGKLLGASALAAVGSTASVNFLVIGFCTGVCSGFAIPVAQQMGAQNHSRMRQYVATAAWLAVGFALLLTVATVALCSAILQAMNTPEDIIAGAYSYIVIIFAGIPACILYNFLAGILRAVGDTKTPVYFLIMASMMNIVLDAVLMVGVGMGVAGAAAATVISQTVSGVACLWYIRKKFPILHIRPGEGKFDGGAAGRLCYMGLPMGLQFSITAIGSITLQAAVNGLGSVAVAGITAGQKIVMFLVCPLESLGATMATYCGQNIGAKRIDRVRAGIGASLLYGFAYALFALILVLLFADQMVLLFLDASEPNLEYILEVAVLFQTIDAVFFGALGALFVLRLAIQGMGFSNFAMLAGVMETVGRAGVAWLLVPSLGYVAACLAHAVAWVMALIFLIPACLWCLHRVERDLMVNGH